MFPPAPRPHCHMHVGLGVIVLVATRENIAEFMPAKRLEGRLHCALIDEFSTQMIAFVIVRPVKCTTCLTFVP